MALDCRYHVVIGPGEGLAVLAFSSPNVEISAELVGLFDEIAATLDFVAA
jgi:hypothetical protein